MGVHVETDLKVGGVYSVSRGGDTFGIVKVLAHQPQSRTIYVRTFKPHVTERPRKDWFENPEVDALDEELGIGIGVLPVTPRVFDYWEPQLLCLQEISAKETQDLGYCLGMAMPWDDLEYP
jgi:hypothetical protein